MHDLASANNLRPKNLGYRLMAQANAQYRKTASVMADGLQRNTALIGRAGARGNHQMSQRQRAHLIKGNSIISYYPNLSTELAKILVEVPGKRVVVINKQQHDCDFRQTRRMRGAFSIQSDDQSAILSCCSG
jgi:hypothetical protein